MKRTALLCAVAAPLSFGYASENPATENNHTFEGRIRAALTRDNQAEELLYTIETKFLRVEPAATNATSPTDILNRNSGELILVFPHNRSFTRLKAVTHSNAASRPPMVSQMPPGASPGLAMPPVPPMAMERLEFHDTNEKTNLLGYACEHFQIHQRGKTMDIWATAELAAFQPYLRSQPPSVAANTIDDQWGEMLKAKRLFPLLASLKLENGLECLRFEVTNITPQTIAAKNTNGFQPPADYHEVLPLPF